MSSLNMVDAILADTKAVITGDHFVYAKKPDGWYHGADYVNKDAVYPFRRSVKTLCMMIACHFSQQCPEAVVGPTVGGVSLKDTVTDFLLQEHSKVLAISADEERVLEMREYDLYRLCENDPSIEFSAPSKMKLKKMVDEKTNNEFLRVSYYEEISTRRVIKRGQSSLIEGKKCLVVEDVINSGKTVKDVIEAVHRAGASVIGVGALVNRSGGRVTAKTLGVRKLFSLKDVDMEMYREEECPICKEKGVKSVRTDLGGGRDFLIRIGELKP